MRSGVRHDPELQNELGVYTSFTKEQTVGQFPHALQPLHKATVLMQTCADTYS